MTKNVKHSPVVNHQLLKVGKGLRVGITLLTDEGRQRAVHRGAVLLHGKAEEGRGGVKKI